MPIWFVIMEGTILWLHQPHQDLLHAARIRGMFNLSFKAWVDMSPGRGNWSSVSRRFQLEGTEMNLNKIFPLFIKHDYNWKKAVGTQHCFCTQFPRHGQIRLNLALKIDNTKADLVLHILELRRVRIAHTPLFHSWGLKMDLRYKRYQIQMEAL